ncbi:MAG TPA: VOC family protein [Solirubrobacteraceae bacterium]|nr:VOC family protein [Solirubrobacteraceae bacterium]
MPVHGIEHVLVLTDDIDGTRDWWADAFGLRPGARPPLPFSGHWLYGEGTGALLHIADRAEYAAHSATIGLAVPDGPAGGEVPIDHVALAATDYDATLARLEALGLEYVANEIPELGVRQLYVHDPNGVCVELNVAPPL